MESRTRRANVRGEYCSQRGYEWADESARTAGEWERRSSQE